MEKLNNELFRELTGSELEQVNGALGKGRFTSKVTYQNTGGSTTTDAEADYNT